MLEALKELKVVDRKTGRNNLLIVFTHAATACQTASMQELTEKAAAIKLCVQDVFGSSVLSTTLENKIDNMEVRMRAFKISCDAFYAFLQGYCLLEAAL